MRLASPMPPIATVGWPRPLALQSITARCGSSALASHVPAMNAPGWAVIVPTIAPCPSQASHASSSARSPSRGHTSCCCVPGRADARHDHDLVVALELVELDEHRAADLEHGARGLEPALEPAATRSEHESAHATAARASSKVSSRMPPVA